MRERRVLYAAAFLRSLATGMVGVILGIYLAKRGYDPVATGAIVGAGLGGAALAALVVTLAGDRVGRRNALVALSLLGALGGLAVALASGIAVIGAAAFVGMLNGMGRDRGASLILDHAILPATCTDAERTKAFAWYNVVQDAGHARRCASSPRSTRPGPRASSSSTWASPLGPRRSRRRRPTRSLPRMTRPRSTRTSSTPSARRTRQRACQADVCPPRDTALVSALLGVS